MKNVRVSSPVIAHLAKKSGGPTEFLTTLRTAAF